MMAEYESLPKVWQAETTRRATQVAASQKAHTAYRKS